MPVEDPVMFSGRLKTRSGLAENHKLRFPDGHSLKKSIPFCINTTTSMNAYV
jgi:hypothetical protein